MPEFVHVWSKRTGRRHSVPAHYLDNPFLMRPFRKAPPGDVEKSSDPSTDWTLKALRDHAGKAGVDLAGAGRNKAAILERIVAAQHPTTVDPTTVPTVPTDPPDDTVSTGETPAAGE